MSYSLKDKKCKIYSTRTEFDNIGNHKNVFKYLGEFWCYSKQLSASTFFQNQIQGINETRIFILNFNPEIKVNDRIFYREDWYEITRVDTADDYLSELYIYVKRAVRPDI